LTEKNEKKVIETIVFDTVIETILFDTEEGKTK
jgi:hypothetical protein